MGYVTTEAFPGLPAGAVINPPKSTILNLLRRGLIIEGEPTKLVVGDTEADLETGELSESDNEAKVINEPKGDIRTVAEPVRADDTSKDVKVEKFPKEKTK